MHLALMLVVTIGSADNSDLLLKVGDRAPPFAMRDLDRKVFSLRNHTGAEAAEPKKAILLAFFATWCKPCMKEIPIVKEIHRRWKGKGRDVEVIYVGLSQGAKELAPFAKKKKLPWRVVPDSFGLLARRYGASQLPHLFIIGPDGRIAFQHRGIAPDLKKTINSQLARVTGASPAEDTGPLDVDAPRFSKTFALGRAPSSAGSAARWQPLAVFVGEQVGANIDVTTEDSYETFEKALRSGKYDLGNGGPLLCHKVKDTYEAVARIERQGSPTYFGIIFTQRNNPIRSMADLRGKTIGLVSERSSSGGLYPQLALLDAGLVPGKDVTIKWLGSHAKVAQAVEAGTVDAGGCFEDCRDAVYPTARAKAAGTRILSYTSDIPGEMILIKRSLDSGTKNRLKEAILALNDAQGILGQISQGETTVTAVLTATQTDLDAVADAVARVTHKKTK
ncbi:PhnD/SsuA/transferrin family substrate-binding protein [Myxococcota bacterium]